MQVETDQLREGDTGNRLADERPPRLGGGGGPEIDDPTDVHRPAAVQSAHPHGRGLAIQIPPIGGDPDHQGNPQGWSGPIEECWEEVGGLFSRNPNAHDPWA